MALPTWLSDALIPAQIRVDSGLMPHQIKADADEEEMDAIISRHVQTHGAYALSRARIAARRLAFPSLDGELALAFPARYPLDADETKIAAIDAAALADRALQIDEQKSALVLAVAEFVIAKLYYALPDSEYEEIAKGHWISAQTLLGTLEKTLRDINTRYNFKTTGGIY